MLIESYLTNCMAPSAPFLRVLEDIIDRKSLYRVHNDHLLTLPVSVTAISSIAMARFFVSLPSLILAFVLCFGRYQHSIASLAKNNRLNDEMIGRHRRRGYPAMYK